VPPFYPNVLYVFIVCMVLFGMGMSYEIKRLESAMAFVAQIALMTYSLYTNEKLNYTSWLEVSSCDLW